MLYFTHKTLFNTDNQLVLNKLKIWYKFRRHFKFEAASSLGPLYNNHLFPPSLSDSTFSVWYDKGLTQFRHLYVANLSSLYDLPVTHLFRYFQTHNFVAKYRKTPGNKPERGCDLPPFVLVLFNLRS